MASENFLRVIPSGSDPWVAVINGEKYMYPAGTEQYVPAEVAVLIDAQELHEQPKYPPAQDDGGGGGDMLVTITENDSAPWYSADKTFAEIAEAIEVGKNVTAFANFGLYMYIPKSMYIPGEMINFCGVMCFLDEGSNPSYGVQSVTITPESVVYNSDTLELAR